MDNVMENIHALKGCRTRASRPRQSSRLRRRSSGRMLGGVASGLAEHLGLDVSLVRAIFVLTTIWGGMGIVAYAVAWALLPTDDGAEQILANRIEAGELSAADYRQMIADMR